MARFVGATLLVVGCAAWAFVVGLMPAVDEAAPAVDGGTEEFQLWAVELRFAALLVVIAGAAVLFARSSLFVSRAYGGLALTAVVLAVVGGLLAISVDAGLNSAVAALALLAAALGMVRASTWLVGRPSSVEYAARAGRDVPRRFLLGVGAILLASVPPAEYFINEFWETELVPGTYEFAAKAIQVLLAVAALAIMAVAVHEAAHPLAHAVPWVIAGISAAVVVLVGWLVVTPTDGGRGMWIVWLCLLVLMPIVAAATDPVVTVRRVALRAGFVAATAPLMFFPAVYVGLAIGLFEFGLAGGSVGVDGIPIYPIGIVSATVACIVCSGVTPLLPKASGSKVAAAA